MTSLPSPGALPTIFLNFSKISKNFQHITPHLFGLPIIGDDFPLGVLMLSYEFNTEHENEVLCCGLCKSGQTIQAATERVKSMEEKSGHIIVYLGSIDIIKGRNMGDIRVDFDKFIEACRAKKLTPILCTLAPLPSHQLGNRKWTLNEFNQNIFRVAIYWSLTVIDINKTFLGRNSSFEEFCFAIAPRAVTGISDFIVPWSREGRNRFVHMIKKNLGFAIVATGFEKLLAI